MTRSKLSLLGFAVAAACSNTPEGPFAVGELALEITSPTPGEELLGDAPTIEITGTVSTTTDSPVLTVWINGAETTVTDGAFTHEIAVEPGIVHVSVEASDGYQQASKSLDIVYAGDYLMPIAGTAGFDVADAIELRLGQRFFDARRFGSDLDLTTDPIVASDLASALELVLHHVQLQELLPDRIQFGSGDTILDIAIGTVTPDRIVVDARIVDTPAKALELHVDLLGVVLPMDGTFRFGNRTKLVDGGITADLHATATLTLGIGPDGAIAVEATTVSGRVGPLVPAFTGPDGEELNALVTLAESDFRTVVEGLITDELIPTFTDRVPPLLETLLGSLGELLSDVNFTLDTPLGGSVTVQLAGNVGGLDVVPGPGISTQPGHVTVRQQLAIMVPGDPIHPESRGAARIANPPLRPVGNATGLDLALRLDLLNSLMHGMWNRGLLEGQAAASGFTVNVSAKLPPVVRATPPAYSCRIDDEPCDVTLQLGQLEVQLLDFGQTFGINATAGARIVVDGNRVSIKIEEVPTLTVWEIANDGDGRLSPQAVSELVTNVVWPMLFDAIGENLGITLPLPDLSTLGLDDIAPGLANAELELAVRPRAGVETGYLNLGADIRLVTPQP